MAPVLILFFRTKSTLETPHHGRSLSDEPSSITTTDKRADDPQDHLGTRVANPPIVNPKWRSRLHVVRPTVMIHSLGSVHAAL